MFKGRLRKLDELVVQRLVQFVVLLDGLMKDRSGNRAGLHEHIAQIDAVGLPARDCFVLIQALDMADGLFKRPETELCQDFADLLCDVHEEVDHVFRLAAEARAQFRILGRDALRAGVLLACSHHHAALGDEGGCREAEFLGSKQRCDHHITAGLELTVALDDDAGA